MPFGFVQLSRLFLSKSYRWFVNQADRVLRVKNSNGVFQDYSSALESIHFKGYSDLELIEVVVAKTNLMEEKLVSKDAFVVFENSNIFRFAPILLAEMSKSTLKVLDFGGAAGYQHCIANTFLGESDKLRWSVVDTAKMVEVASKISRKNRYFFDSIEAALIVEKGFDVSISSSSLQYCDQPLNFLRALVEVKAKYLIIQKTPLLDGKATIVSLQKSRLSDNGPGQMPKEFQDRYITYPITFVPESTFEDIIQMHYQIRFKVYDESERFSSRAAKINTVNYFCTLKPEFNQK